MKEGRGSVHGMCSEAECVKMAFRCNVQLKGITGGDARGTLLIFCARVGQVEVEKRGALA
jgi:hypothetical protein